jgi:RNA-directed DNA polymerase
MKIAKSWNDINWAEAKRDLASLQYEILKAHRGGDSAKALEAQNNLVRSFAARSLAVRKVTSNQGKNTPGVDKVIFDTPAKKFEAIETVKNLKGYKASPVKRIYIPKANGKLRPLGIPTMKDRVVQTMYLFALDPIAEETSDSRSYGFRPYRGVNDNATYLKLVLGSVTATRRFVLDADIEGFFDSVGHQWLMDHIPVDKRILKEFLTAGFVDKSVFYDTSLGFPQGSPISPTLANMALNGLQEHVGKDFLFTRYADDFLIIGKSEKDLKDIAMPSVEEFLKPRGLRLNKSKTSIAEISNGFDFLGFHFREYPDKTRVKGTKKGILLVKPSNKNIKSSKGKSRN